MKNSLKVLFPLCLLLCQQVTAGDFDAQEQSFDEIDKMLDRNFQQTNAQIDQLYNAYNKAISDAFAGITKKIQVEWPDNIRLPEKSIWVGYSKDLKTRSIVDYQQGELIIEAKVSNKNLDQARLEIEVMAKRLSADKNNAIEELDLFTTELKNNLVQRGIALSPDIGQIQGDKPNILKHLLPPPQTIASLVLTSIDKSLPKVQDATSVEPAAVQKVKEVQEEISVLAGKTQVNQAQIPSMVDDIQRVEGVGSVPVVAQLKQPSSPEKVSKPLTLIAPASSQAAKHVQIAKEQSMPSVEQDGQVTMVDTAPAVAVVAPAPAVLKSGVDLSLPLNKVSKKTPSRPEIKLELVKQGDESVLKMSIKFVNKYQEILMAHNFSDVKAYSAQYDVPVSVILAIIETESSYNPRAISNVPAFGLMQLVPKTAGVDAHNYVFGEKKIVSADYLFDESHNIQLGTAYFKLLKSRYLRKIKDPTSRFYCAVASYNTGVGNLAKTFTGSKNLSKAALKINQLTPEQVYAYLIEHLPAKETRNYLKKIVKRAGHYLHLDNKAGES